MKQTEVTGCHDCPMSSELVENGYAYPYCKHVDSEYNPNYHPFTKCPLKTGPLRVNLKNIETNDLNTKSITFPAKIIELGDNEYSNTPQLYLMQETGNRLVIDVNRPFLIRLVRGDGEKFSVYDNVNLTISISKK
jgi:hypothetical protein